MQQVSFTVDVSSLRISFIFEQDMFCDWNILNQMESGPGVSLCDHFIDYRCTYGVSVNERVQFHLRMWSGWSDLNASWVSSHLYFELSTCDIIIKGACSYQVWTGPLSLNESSSMALIWFLISHNVRGCLIKLVKTLDTKDGITELMQWK